MRVELCAVTPAMATSWLKTNIVNRAAADPTVKRYASDMTAGRWKKSHQGIAFDRNGNLIDGQHRLLAVIKSGCTIEMLVAFDCDEESFRILDLGRGRSGGDALGLDGIADPRHTAAVARNMLIYGERVRNVSTPAVYEYAVANRDLIQDFVPLAKTFTSACAAGFCFHEKIGTPGVRDAMRRLLMSDFLPVDPMKDLVRELNALRGSHGGGSQDRRFKLATAALVLSTTVLSSSTTTVLKLSS